MKELELMEKIITTLDSISIPAGLTEQIAFPICKCSNALKDLYRGLAGKLMAKDEKPAEEAEERKEEEQ